jgi:glutathione S-transferase
MILVGRYRSPFARRVAISMRLLGIEYEHRPIKPWPTNEKLLPLNPMGRVPILFLDNGERLLESGYMIEYLDQLVGPDRALTPFSGPERLAVQEIVYLALGTQEKVILANHERYRRPEGFSERGWIDRCESQAAAGLAELDRFQPHPWLTGDTINQADITLGVLCDHIRLTCPEMIPDGKYPNLDKFAVACLQLPAFEETIPDF